MAQNLPLGLQASIVETAWVPSPSFSTPGTSSFAVTVANGSYIKIGQFVAFQYNLQFTPTVGSASGVFTINGLPLPFSAVIGGGVSQGIFAGTQTNFGGVTIPANTLFLTPSTTRAVGTYSFNIITVSSTGGAGGLQPSNFTTGTPVSLIGSGQYYTPS